MFYLFGIRISITYLYYVSVLPICICVDKVANKLSDNIHVNINKNNSSNS